MTQNLQRELDRVKSLIFKGDNAAFLSSIMASLDYEFRSDPRKPAYNTGKRIVFDPDFFLSLTPAARFTVLLHELWHSARLYWARMGDRIPKIWNEACDIRINNDLENEGRSFEGLEWVCKDHSVDDNGILSEEEIYDLLIQRGRGNGIGGFNGSWGQGTDWDLPEQSEIDRKGEIEIVVRAIQQAKIVKEAGKLPGNLEQTVSDLLSPVVPWQPVLREFLTDLDEEDYSYHRPNRRYQDVYLPSRLAQEGRLEHLAWFMDVSYSIEDWHLRQFSGEFKHVHDILRPQKMTLVQFSTQIVKIEEYDEHTPFEQLRALGRGGTDLRPVHDWIEKNRPTAAVIFTDLEVPPMEKLKSRTPVIWIVVDNPNATVPFGRLVHVPPQRR